VAESFSIGDLAIVQERTVPRHVVGYKFAEQCGDIMLFHHPTPEEKW
jgi:hypothetical protein